MCWDFEKKIKTISRKKFTDIAPAGPAVLVWKDSSNWSVESVPHFGGYKTIPWEIVKTVLGVLNQQEGELSKKFKIFGGIIFNKFDESRWVILVDLHKKPWSLSQYLFVLLMFLCRSSTEAVLM